MSTYEYIFMQTELPKGQAAERLAEALTMQIVQDDAEVYIRADAFGEFHGVIGGKVYINIYSSIDYDPEDRAPYDRYPLVWRIWYEERELDRYEAAARALFDRIIETLHWPVLLVHDLQTVGAAWDPDRGIREFPPGTSLDVSDEPIWG